MYCTSLLYTSTVCIRNKKSYILYRYRYLTIGDLAGKENKEGAKQLSLGLLTFCSASFTPSGYFCLEQLFYIICVRLPVLVFIEEAGLGGGGGGVVFFFLI